MCGGEMKIATVNRNNACAATSGYVAGVGAASFDQLRGNLAGDPYFTDGLRSVIFVSADPVAIDEIEFIDVGQHPLLVRQ